MGASQRTRPICCCLTVSPSRPVPAPTIAPSNQQKRRWRRACRHRRPPSRAREKATARFLSPPCPPAPAGCCLLVECCVSINQTQAGAAAAGSERVEAQQCSRQGSKHKGIPDEAVRRVAFELGALPPAPVMWRYRGRCAAAAAALCAAAGTGTGSSLTLAPLRARASAAAESEAGVYDVAIVGGGVVGLAVAREIAVRGRTVVLLEREDAPAAAASSGNSGIGCTGYDAPVGTLERRLLRRAIQLHPSLLRSFGMSYEHVRKCGSLVVAWTPEQLEALPRVVAENREAGDTEAVQLTAAELHELEPTLSTAALGAVLCPRESVVEPWLVPAGYAHSARINGAELRMNTELKAVDYTEGLWRLTTRPTSSAPFGRSPPGKLLVSKPEPARGAPWGAAETTVRARAVVNCAGLFGDAVEQMRTGNNPSQAAFTVTPRKGQFVVFKPDPRAAAAESSGGAPSHIIEPVPTEFTKGVIVFTTVYGNVVVGPTAVDQPDKLDRSTDFGTVRQLRGAIGVTFAPSPHLILTSSSPHPHPVLTLHERCMQRGVKKSVRA